MRRLLLVAAVGAAAVLAAARPDAALAQAGGDTTAVAVNTKDGSSVFKLAFAIKRVGSDVVDNTNAAVAFASCESCKTVAISIQVVLVTGDPSVATPTNLAIAINYECTLCETLASAYQWVLSTDGPVHFSAEGNREVARIRHELRELAKSNLPVEELQARVEQLMRELAQVLERELVAAGKPPAAQQPSAETTPATTTRPTEPPPPAGTTTEEEPPVPPETLETETTQTTTSP